MSDQTIGGPVVKSDRPSDRRHHRSKGATAAKIKAEGQTRALTRFSDERRDTFIEGLRQGLSVTGAADKAGMSRMAMYQEREKNAEFGQRWADAIESGTDALEDAAHSRAMTVSDTLAIFLLKARRPAKYRERIDVNTLHQHEHQHTLKVADLQPHQLDALARVFSELADADRIKLEGPKD